MFFYMDHESEINIYTIYNNIHYYPSSDLRTVSTLPCYSSVRTTCIFDTCPRRASLVDRPHGCHKSLELAPPLNWTCTTFVMDDNMTACRQQRDRLWVSKLSDDKRLLALSREYMTSGEIHTYVWCNGW